MKHTKENTAQSGRTWVAPVLKKVDLKQVTAGGPNKNEHDVASKS